MIDNTPSKEVLITMLRFALLEIRAGDNQEFSKSIADIFHHLPSELLLDWDEGVSQSAYGFILNKAERYKLKGYILSLREAADKSVAP